MNETTGAKYITPTRFEKMKIFGAAYDINGQVILESLRKSDKAAIKHYDSVYINTIQKEYMEVPGNNIYLGHCFSHYGHFLLETLPMLNRYIENETENYYFIPFKKQNRNILDCFLEILNYKKSRFNLHTGIEILKGKFEVHHRPIIINDRLLNTEPYKKIIEKLKNNVEYDSTKNRKIFLKRKADRTSEFYSNIIENFFINKGFEIINPETTSLNEQLKIYFETGQLAGISGSALHNAMFLNSSSHLIEIADERTPEKQLPNQLSANKISQCKNTFITFQKEISLNKTKIEKYLKETIRI